MRSRSWQRRCGYRFVAVEMERHVNIQNPEIPYTPDDTGVIQVTECIAQLAIDEIPSASFTKG